MEKLSRAYINALVAEAGFITDSSDFDRDSIDLTISAGDSMRPKIDVQLKATTRMAASAKSYSHTISLKNYDDLRIRTLVPRILVVLAMPKQEVSWINHNNQRLILRRCAFWKSLRDFPEVDNTTSVSVPLDLAQVLTVDSLRNLMDLARSGSAL